MEQPVQGFVVGASSFMSVSMCGAYCSALGESVGCDGFIFNETALDAGTEPCHTGEEMHYPNWRAWHNGFRFRYPHCWMVSQPQ